MSLLNRSRLRWLRTLLVGPPQLVIPAPVVGDHRWLTPRAHDDDDFLWGSERTFGRWERRGIVIKGPSDAEWREQYQALHRGVTYDPIVARQRLLRMLTNDQDQQITSLVTDA